MQKTEDFRVKSFHLDTEMTLLRAEKAIVGFAEIPIFGRYFGEGEIGVNQDVDEVFDWGWSFFDDRSRCCPPTLRHTEVRSFCLKNKDDLPPSGE
jgi:hypothetical protein